MGTLKGGGDSSSWELSEVMEVTVLRLDRERLSKLSKLSGRLEELDNPSELAKFNGKLGKFRGKLIGKP